jgi:hypothetical protein
MSTTALARWLEALNARGDQAATRRAVDDEVRIERCGFHATRDQVLEVLNGAVAVNDWLALTRDVVEFRLDGDSRCDAGGEIAARYAVVVEAANFRGGGEWHLRLANDGRIAWLRHQPDDLEQATPEPDPGHQPGHAHDHG